MGKLNFFDVDDKYIKYLQKQEFNKRGFSRVPNVVYNNEQKFLCGIVLLISDFKYYVPVTSYNKKQSENILIIFPEDKYNQIKGSLRFNYMIPVPDNEISVRRIKDEEDPSRRIFLQKQLNFCNSNYTKILTRANRTYDKIIKKYSLNLNNNSCDFKLLEQKCLEYEQHILNADRKQTIDDNKGSVIDKLKNIKKERLPNNKNNDISF